MTISSNARAGAEFTTVRSEGTLLPPDLLRRIVNADADLGGFAPEEYGLERRERLGDAAARAWARAKDYWAAFRAATSDLRPGESDLQPTRHQWLLPLLRELGYREPEFRAAAEVIDERRYPINYRSGPVPLHLVGFRQELGRLVASGSGTTRMSPHALLQEYLNVGGSLYGIVSNGLVIRLLRDNASLTRQSYLEFDLQAMFDGGVYSDFVLFFLALHRTRLPLATTADKPCWLERWRAEAESRGTRALGELRKGVENAIVALGSGFLAHPANEELRQRLIKGELPVAEYYAQLLRLVYRLIFLFVAEERNLIYPPGADPANQRRYREHYAASRLRQIARKQRADGRHDDLWRGLQLTFDLVGGRRSALDLTALGGGLFNIDSCRDLDPALLGNDALAEAIVQLSWVRVAKVTRWVSYRDMDAEELGGVYEGLLERQPSLRADSRFPRFELIGSGQRKQTGSYYTPTVLVDELVRSALEPVIAARLTGAKTRSDQRAALLGITVCDPACGSGHFLLAGARRIARELARVEAGGDEPSPEQTRAALRDVIRHCIYGVDLNPLAVDLCRLALWLEGHDPGRGLTFLDHHVKVGNSLVGVADLNVLAEGIPDEAYVAVADDDKPTASALKKRNREERKGQTSAFATGLSASLEESLARLASGFDALRNLDEENAGDERVKRELYESLLASADLRDRQTACDLWTAAYFAPLVKPAPGQETLAPTTETVRQFLRRPGAAHGALIGMAGQLREDHHFFHWPLEFPEVIQARGGFDCVLGNPPWERIKLQESEFFAEREPEIAQAPNQAARQRLIALLAASEDGQTLYAEFQTAKRAAEAESKYVRGSGRFPLTAVGDVNLYALFAELDRDLLNDSGRSGVIVPTGIATDDSTKRFFQSVVDRSALATLFDFENRGIFFPSVHASYKFCLLTLSAAPVPRGDLAFFVTNVEQLRDDQRRFQLSAEDFALLNPNTHTCPVFRTRTDAELTRAIYRRVPVLVDEANGINPWGVEVLRMFDMSNDSNLFRDAPGPGLVPLYEGKMVQAFDHRAASVETIASNLKRPGQPRDLSVEEHVDPSFRPTPQYWIEKREVDIRIRERGALLAFKSVTSPTNQRTVIGSLLPVVGVANSMIVVLLERWAADLKSCLTANLNALILDYVAKQKIGGVNLNFFLVNQLPFLLPSVYARVDLDFIVPRVLELTYTAWDLQPFAQDLGYDGPPFPWNEEHRAVLRAELDAYYAALYGLTRDELRYILDPADVYGPDFPGETFRVLKERELREHGEYRTRRLVLEAWDRLGLEPRNRDGRYEVEAPATKGRAVPGNEKTGHRHWIKDSSFTPADWSATQNGLPGVGMEVQASFENLDEQSKP